LKPKKNIETLEDLIKELRLLTNIVTFTNARITIDDIMYLTETDIIMFPISDRIKIRKYIKDKKMNKNLKNTKTLEDLIKELELPPNTSDRFANEKVTIDDIIHLTELDINRLFSYISDKIKLRKYINDKKNE